MSVTIDGHDRILFSFLLRSKAYDTETHGDRTESHEEHFASASLGVSSAALCETNNLQRSS